VLHVEEKSRLEDIFGILRRNLVAVEDALQAPSEALEELLEGFARRGGLGKGLAHRGQRLRGW
jgi:hypothetical protein